MDIAPFFQAELATQIHVVAALFALVSGVVVFTMRKGTARHKMLGKAWFAAMVVTALSSFAIHGLRTWGLFSPLHLLSLYTLGILVFAVIMVRRGHVRAHKLSLIGLFIGGLVGAGLLTLSRGLLMSRILFPNGDGFVPAPEDLPGGPVVAGFIVAVIATVLTFALGFVMEEDKR